MALPHKPQRSPTGRKKSIVERGVTPPAIFVAVKPHGYFQNHYAQASIRVRSGCYRYLVWRDGGKKREFYLGKVKNPAPQPQLGRPAPARSQTGVRNG
jgi:hypothetical protein